MKPLHFQPPAQTARGYTLIEITVVVAILAVILSIAVPDFSQWFANTRLTAQANDIVADMLYARAEAASRGVQAVVCSSTDSSTCANSNNWATGRVVRMTSLGASTPSVPKITAALSGSNTLAGIDGDGADVTQITFNPYGGIIVGSNTLPLKLKLCSPSLPTGRFITVGANGRPIITRDATCP